MCLAMNVVYEALLAMPPAVLRSLWHEADPYTEHGALLRHQIQFTVERLLSGRWEPK